MTADVEDMAKHMAQTGGVGSTDDQTFQSSFGNVFIPNVKDLASASSDSDCDDSTDKDEAVTEVPQSSPTKGKKGTSSSGQSKVTKEK
eukprot:642366-Lingulodinium_polyedra.AAC.1